MIGFSGRLWRSSACQWMSGTSDISFMNSSSDSPAPMAFRSAPAQKTSPRPVRIATRSSGSSSSMRQARYIPASMPGLRAFFASGRFRVTVSTWPSRSSRQWSRFIEVPHPMLSWAAARRAIRKTSSSGNQFVRNALFHVASPRQGDERAPPREAGRPVRKGLDAAGGCPRPSLLLRLPYNGHKVRH